MSRETFGSCLQTSKDYCVDDNTTTYTNLSATDTFLKKEINKTVRLIKGKLRNFKTTELPKTCSSAEDQQYYHYPPGLGFIETITVTSGGIAYPMTVINSQQAWEQLNEVDFTGNIFPQFVFPRQDDFGIWPIPADDSLTITFNSINMPKDMTASDYADGTVTITSGSQTVTGSSSVWTASMVGRWFKVTGDEDWYRISAFSSTTSITLESAFEGSSVAGASYTIGESPEIPSDLHELIPYKAAAAYTATRRRDPVAAQAFLNYFWTGDFNNNTRIMKNAAGGLLAAIRDYNALGRENSRLVNHKHFVHSRFDERWSGAVS